MSDKDSPRTHIIYQVLWKKKKHPGTTMIAKDFVSMQGRERKNKHVTHLIEFCTSSKKKKINK